MKLKCVTFEYDTLTNWKQIFREIGDTNVLDVLELFRQVGLLISNVNVVVDIGEAVDAYDEALDEGFYDDDKMCNRNSRPH